MNTVAVVVVVALVAGTVLGTTFHALLSPFSRARVERLFLAIGGMGAICFAPTWSTTSPSSSTFSSVVTVGLIVVTSLVAGTAMKVAARRAPDV
jgi:hypothetical protein